MNRVSKDATELTEISFENIENLSLQFQNIVQPKMRFVFTNIVDNEIFGSVSGRSLTIEMFFRQLKKATKGETSVTFRNVNVEAKIRLLNFQNIGHLRVVDSHFENIKFLDILHSPKCHTSLNSYIESEVTCSKNELFYSSTYASERYF